MPRITEFHHEERRKEILRRCVECFAKKGFHQTSMRDLGKELGMSLGGLYVYFKSKEEMIEAFIELDRALAKTIFNGATPEMTFWQGIEKMVEISNLAMEQPSARVSCVLWAQINAEAMINPKVMQLVAEYYQYAADQLTKWIRAGQNRGELRDDFDPAVLAKSLISVSDGLIFWGMLNPQEEVENHLSLFLRLIHDSLGAKAKPHRKREKGGKS